MFEMLLLVLKICWFSACLHALYETADWAVCWQVGASITDTMREKPSRPYMTPWKWTEPLPEPVSSPAFMTHWQSSRLITLMSSALEATHIGETQSLVGNEISRHCWENFNYRVWCDGNCLFLRFGPHDEWHWPEALHIHSLWKWPRVQVG